MLEFTWEIALIATSNPGWEYIKGMVMYVSLCNRFKVVFGFFFFLLIDSPFALFHSVA